MHLTDRRRCVFIRIQRAPFPEGVVAELHAVMAQQDPELPRCRERRHLVAQQSLRPQSRKPGRNLLRCQRELAQLFKGLPQAGALLNRVFMLCAGR
jgi:hypothetical protein